MCTTILDSFLGRVITTCHKSKLWYVGSHQLGILVDTEEVEIENLSLDESEMEAITIQDD